MRALVTVRPAARRRGRLQRSARCRLAGCLGVAALGFFLVPSAGVAGAEPVGGGEPAPTVVFLDNRELNVSYEDLKKAGGLVVGVRNARASPQQVSVAVDGLWASTDPAARRLLARSVRAVLRAGQTRRLLLPLEPRSKSPKSGTYTAAMVAFGESGGVARRGISVEVAEKEEPRGIALAAEDLADQTLQGTNRTPSLLSPVGPTALLIAILLVTLFLILHGWRNGRRGLVLALLLPAAVLSVLALACWGVSEGEREEQGNIAKVEVDSVPVAPSVAEGTIGAVSSERGDVAVLKVAEQELDVAGLQRAGKYSGKLDFTPGVEGGDATAVVNVRDLWIYAFAVLAGGVALGYLLRRYFQQGLPRAEVEDDADALFAQIVLADSARQERFEHAPFRAYRILERARRLVEDAKTKAAEDVAEGAKRVTDLEAYATAFESLLDELDALEGSVSSLERAGADHKLGPDQVKAVQQARRLMQLDFDSPTPDPEQKELKARVAQAEAAKKFADMVTDMRASSESALTLARVLAAASPEKERKNQLDALVTQLEVFGPTLLVTSEGGLEELRKALDGHLSQLARLGEEHKAHEQVAPELAEELRDAWPSGLEDNPLKIVIEEVEVGPPTSPKVDIACRVFSLGVTSDGCAGNRDDSFEFTASFTHPEQLPSTGLMWDFGDGSATRRVRRPEDANQRLSARHQFKTSGTRTVRLLGADESPLLGQDGKPLPGAELYVEVGPSRSDRARKRTAQRRVEMTWIAGLLAVASGLSALYFSNAAWGTGGDYLAAVLWGSAVAEGVAYAAALADRIWPMK